MSLFHTTAFEKKSKKCEGGNSENLRKSVLSIENSMCMNVRSGWGMPGGFNNRLLHRAVSGETRSQQSGRKDHL